MRILAVVTLAAALLGGPVPAQQPVSPNRGRAKADIAATRPEAGVDVTRFDEIPPLVEQAVKDRKTPGAVVLIGRGDRVLWQKAIGHRAVEPAIEAMTPDTIFDLASLTKVVATTTSVMQLLEDGRIRLNDRVADYIQGFERYHKAGITIRHLMTHTSGLRPDLDLADAWNGYDKAIALAIEEVPTAPPGERFVYSDINYELLGEIVHRVSGQTLDVYARAAGDEGYDVPSAGGAALADCANGEVHAVRLALRRARRHLASRGRP